LPYSFALAQNTLEQDMTLEEVEELSASKRLEMIQFGEIMTLTCLILQFWDPYCRANPSNLIRSLTMRLDNVKNQYQQHKLVPLTQQREILAREVAELKAVRDREWTRKVEIVQQNGNEMFVAFRAVSFDFPWSI